MKKKQEKRSRMEIFDNRRKYPRLKMQLPVALKTPKGKIIKAFINNISPDGTQISYKLDDRVDVFHEEVSSYKKLESCKCSLRFDLSIIKSVSHVNIGAHPVYLQSINKDESVSGMFFSEENLVENKKITDFLFYQLQTSFGEMEYSGENAAKDDAEPVINARRNVIETTQYSEPSGAVKNISDEVDELILQMGISKAQLEPVRQILFRILSSLKVIQELTRHTDERITNLEHKISRLG